MPDPSPGRAGAADTAPLEYVTRFVATPTVTASKVLPYVEDAIRTVGFGSAVAVGEAGIQLTVPVQLMHFLEATINDYEKAGTTVQEFVERKFYPPAIRIKAASPSLKDVVDALGLCPPDMRVEWIGLGDSGVLLVSGPPGRETHFVSTVLPSLKTFANQLNPSFGLPPH